MENNYNELMSLLPKLPLMVQLDIIHRTYDYLEHGNKEDQYIENQLRYAKLVLEREQKKSS